MLKEKPTLTESLQKLVERLQDEEISFRFDSNKKYLVFDLNNIELLIFADNSLKTPYECLLRVYRREDWWNDYSLYHGAELDSVVDTIREFV